MNEDRFYINELSEIRGFCLNSDKEDIYKYIYSLQQENQSLKDRIEELESEIKHLKEEMKYREQDIEDNYKRISVEEQL